MSVMSIVPVAAKEKPQVPAALVATHGYLHVAFPKGGGVVFSVVPVTGGKPVKIDTSAQTLPISHAQAHGKWLPAGRYRISAWGDTDWDAGLEFDVQAGRATDLGDLLPVNVGGYQLVLVPIAHPEHEGALMVATEPFAALLTGGEPIRAHFTEVSPAIALDQQRSGMGLVADMLVAYDRHRNKPSLLEGLKAAKEPATFLRILRTLTPPLQDEAARMADGALYFPADLGQVRRRTPDGEWSSLGVGTLRQLLAVEADGMRLLAGSDDGHLYESFDGGMSWTVLKMLARRETVLDIDHDEQHWLITTTESFDDAGAPRSSGLLAAGKSTPSLTLRVYVANHSDLSDLALSRQFVLSPKDQIGWLGARGQLVDGRYFIVAGNTIQRLTLATGQWSALAPGPKVGGLRVDSATGLLTALWSQGAFSKLYVSADHGDSWAQIGRPPYVIHDVQMDDKANGWASRWNMNAFGGVWETYAFAPDKNDWVKSGEAPFNCKLMRVAKDVPTLCFAPDVSILSLRDGQWQVEFSAQ